MLRASRIVGVAHLYYLRVGTILFSTFGGMATIREWRLIESGI